MGADADWQRFEMVGSSGIGSWRVLNTLSRALSSRLSCSLAYTFFQTSGIYSATDYSLTRSAGRITLSSSFADNTGRPRNDTNF